MAIHAFCLDVTPSRAWYSSKRFRSPGRHMKAKKLAADALWNYALRSLAQRTHSASELRRKLAARAASPEDTRATMEKLREYGLTDDRRFAEAFSAARLQNRSFGKMRVLRELRGRNVAPKVAEEAVRHAFDGVDERQLAGEFLQRKYRNKNLAELLQDPRQLAAAYRKLRLGGFSASSAIGVLKQYANAAQELSDLESESE